MGERQTVWPKLLPPSLSEDPVRHELSCALDCKCTLGELSGGSGRPEWSPLEAVPPKLFGANFPGGGQVVGKNLKQTHFSSNRRNLRNIFHFLTAIVLFCFSVSRVSILVHLESDGAQIEPTHKPHARVEAWSVPNCSGCAPRSAHTHCSAHFGIFGFLWVFCREFVEIFACLQKKLAKKKRGTAQRVKRTNTDDAPKQSNQRIKKVNNLKIEFLPTWKKAIVFDA